MIFKVLLVLGQSRCGDSFFWDTRALPVECLNTNLEPELVEP